MSSVIPDKLMAIYNRSPIFLQNVFTTMQGLKYRRARYGREYRKALAEFESRDYSDSAGMRALQDRLFKELVDYACSSSPFYREFYKNIDIASVQTVGDIQKLPVLEKETVRANLEKIYTISPAEGSVSYTSGTTGKTMRVYFTKRDRQRRMAYLDHFKMQHGFIPMKMKRASFNSSKIVPPGQRKKVFWRTNGAIRQRVYSGHYCKGDNVKYYVEDLNRYRPQSLDGYPSAIYELAKYIVNNNVKLSFVPIAIFPTAETLLPHYRQLIEKAFGCPVRDQYASSEGAPFITECRCGRLHCCMDTGVIEADADGEILVTSFSTHGTPLIRYAIGDRIVFAPEGEKCECGSCFPVVERIEGRSSDFLQSKTQGRFTSVYLSVVSGALAKRFDFMNSIRAIQYVQNTADEIEVHICADETYDPLRMNRIVTDELRHLMGDDMRYTVHLVDDIPKEASGKLRMVINNCPKAQN